MDILALISNMFKRPLKGEPPKKAIVRQVLKNSCCFQALNFVDKMNG
jgi:hypothetical protein